MRDADVLATQKELHADAISVALGVEMIPIDARLDEIVSILRSYRADRGWQTVVGAQRPGESHAVLLDEKVS